MPRGDEERLVVRPFLDWLESEGWTITRIRVGNVPGPDVEAISPNGTKYLFEAKDHRTTTPSGTNPENIDMWTVLGQILTHMGKGDSEYGVVVPASAKWLVRTQPRSGNMREAKAPSLHGLQGVERGFSHSLSSG